MIDLMKGINEIAKNATLEMIEDTFNHFVALVMKRYSMSIHDATVMFQNKLQERSIEHAQELMMGLNMSRPIDGEVLRLERKITPIFRQVIKETCRELRIVPSEEYVEDLVEIKFASMRKGIYQSYRSQQS